MVTDVLVDNKVVDGQRLIDRLIHESFDVTVAFWAKTDEGVWQLWIASPAIDEKNPKEALHKVFTVLGNIPGCEVMPSEIKLINAKRKEAQSAVEARDRRPSRKPIFFQGRHLGIADVEESLIYPNQSPWEVRERDGQWEVLISDSDDWLSCDSEEDARVLSMTPVLKYEALARVRSGPKFADELENTANVLAKYRLGFASRFLRRRADENRK